MTKHHAMPLLPMATGGLTFDSIVHLLEHRPRLGHLVGCGAVKAPLRQSRAFLPEQLQGREIWVCDCHRHNIHLACPLTGQELCLSCVFVFVMRGDIAFGLDIVL